jgi:hypothetical protein
MPQGPRPRPGAAEVFSTVRAKKHISKYELKFIENFNNFQPKVFIRAVGSYPL